MTGNRNRRIDGGEMTVFQEHGDRHVTLLREGNKFLEINPIPTDKLEDDNVGL